MPSQLSRHHLWRATIALAVCLGPFGSIQMEATEAMGVPQCQKGSALSAWPNTSLELMFTVLSVSFGGCCFAAILPPQLLASAVSWFSEVSLRSLWSLTFSAPLLLLEDTV